MIPSFDLLDQPWLPCIDREGRAVELGIRDALLRAHDLSDLHDPSPLTTAALLRLLLAVLHAALRGPRTTPERIAIWEEGCLPAALIDSYLADWAGRFDLFDPIYPFYQDPKLTNEPADTIARLAVELASGNNPTLFDHSHDTAAAAISPAECARWLVTTQAFAIGGGNSAQSNAYTHPRFYDAPAAKAACILLKGTNLFRTLVLNLVRYTDREPIPRVGGHKEECPAWERCRPLPPDGRPAYGYLDYLTWQSRCVHVRPEMDGGQWRVRRAFLSQGSYIPKEVIPREPFWAYVTRKDGSRPLKLSEDRCLWRDSAALFGFAAPNKVPAVGEAPRPKVFDHAETLCSLPGAPTTCQTVVTGIAVDTKGRKAASVKLWRLEELPIPVSLLLDWDIVHCLANAINRAEEIGGVLTVALLRWADGVLRPGGNDQMKQENRQRAEQLAKSWGAEATYWPALEAPFRELLGDVAESPDEAVRVWTREAIQAADAAFDLAGAQAGFEPRVLRARARAWNTLWQGTKKWRKRQATAGQHEEDGTYGDQ